MDKSLSLTQCSGTSEVTEQLEKVNLSPAASLNRDQRRLLDHLRKKFNIAEEEALDRATNYNRKKRNLVEPKSGPAKRTKSDGASTEKAKVPTDCEGTSAGNSVRASTAPKAGTRVAECATKAPKNNTQKHSKNVKADRAKVTSSGAGSTSLSKKGIPGRTTSRSESAPKVDLKRKADNPPPPSGNTHRGKKPTLTLAEALKCKRMAIVGEKAFSDDERDRIKDAICDVVALRSEDDIPPEFHGVMNRLGYLVATVADSESALWLLNNQEEIATVSNCSLRIMSEDAVPVRRLYRAVFSHSKTRTTENIFATLEGFSRDRSFSTRKWELVRRVEDGATAVLFINVDEASADYIKSKKFALPFRLGHANFYRTWNEEKVVVDDTLMPVDPTPTQPPPVIELDREKLESTPGGSGVIKKPNIQITLPEAVRRSTREKARTPTGSNGLP